MKRLMMILGCVMCVSGCLPDEDTRLADLSADERERVCKRSTHEKVTCDDGKEYDEFTQDECEDALNRLAGSNCVATVEDIDDLTSDPCSPEAERARASFTNLQCILGI